MISPFYFNQKSHTSIHIFKTNIKTMADAEVVKKLLNSSLGIKKFSIDLEDVDSVLRIEAHKNLNETDIMNKVTSEGFICEELE